jgi:putative hydrolase of the HAD superfamily
VTGIRAVTFDAAGTLVTPAAPVGRTYAAFAARSGIAAAPAAVEAAFRRALAAAPPLAFPGVDPATVPARERAWWRDVVRAALGAPPGPALDACFDALYAHYAGAAAWRVFPDVAPTLARLRAAGLGLGVVSNFDARLDGLLAGLGLAPAFDAVVRSSAVGAAKPEPAVFAAAARALGVPLAALLHVGDDARADAAGARAAGAQALLLDRRGIVPDALADLHALPSRLGLAQP